MATENGVHKVAFTMDDLHSSGEGPNEKFVPPALYSSKSMHELSIRDSQEKASVHMDDVRGMEENVINFLLTAPLTVSVIGAGYKGGQPHSGVEGGPQAIRQAGLVDELKKLHWEVADKGDIDFNDLNRMDSDPPARNGTKNPRKVGEACHRIFETAYDCQKKGHLALTLGGDHSLAIGSISATLRAWQEMDPVVIWIDAHGDINTPDTSPSGNLHGMPVAFLMDLVDTSDVPGFEWFKPSRPILKPDHIVYIGLRDVDPGEKKMLRKFGIKVFSMTEVDKYGIGKVMEMAINHVIPDRKNHPRAIHLSYDIDACDPTVVPSTGTKVKGGLTYREARYICDAVAETGLMVALDIVELNPTIGNSNDVKQSAELCVDLIRSALGMKLW